MFDVFHYIQLFNIAPDNSFNYYVLVSILLFKHYSHQICNLVFSILCRHNRLGPTTFQAKPFLVWLDQFWQPNFLPQIKFKQLKVVNLDNYFHLDQTFCFSSTHPVSLEYIQTYRVCVQCQVISSCLLHTYHAWEIFES